MTFALRGILSSLKDVVLAFCCGCSQRWPLDDVIKVGSGGNVIYGCNEGKLFYGRGRSEMNIRLADVVIKISLKGSQIRLFSDVVKAGLRTLSKLAG